MPVDAADSRAHTSVTVSSPDTSAVVTVVEPIHAGRGKVRVDDGEWLAKGPDAPAGAQVRILGSEGTWLLVEPVIA